MNLGLGSGLDLTPDGREDLAERLPNTTRGEPDLLDTVNIGELFCTFFEHGDGAREAQRALEEAQLMNHVLPCLHGAISHRIFRGEDQERNGTPAEHAFENVSDCMTCAGPDLIGFDCNAVLVLEMISQVSPQGRSAMPEEHNRSWWGRRWLCRKTRIGPGGL